MSLPKDNLYFRVWMMNDVMMVGLFLKCEEYAVQSLKTSKRILYMKNQARQHVGLYMEQGVLSLCVSKGCPTRGGNRSYPWTGKTLGTTWVLGEWKGDRLREGVGVAFRERRKRKENTLGFSFSQQNLSRCPLPTLSVLLSQQVWSVPTQQ